MLALVNFGAEPHSVELRDLPEPQINEDEVLLEVGAVGVCGSDLHQYTGQHSWKVNYPVVLGHEFGGVIAKTGARVRKFREGDRVVSETAAVLDLDSPFMIRGQPLRRAMRRSTTRKWSKFFSIPKAICSLILRSK